MDCRLILRATALLTVWTSVNTKEITKDFSCCNLPIKIPLNRSHEYEFTIKHKSMAIATQASIKAQPPFAVWGNTTLSMDNCEDYDQKIILDDEQGFAEEKMIHHHGLPCNRTAPDNLSQGHTNTVVAVVVVVVIVVLGFLGGVIGAIVHHFKKKTREGNNGVV